MNLLLSFGVSPRVVMEIVGHNQRAALDLLNDRIAGAGEGGE